MLANQNSASAQNNHLIFTLAFQSQSKTARPLFHLGLAIFLSSCATNSFALALGDAVEANGAVHVRQTPAGALLGTQNSGSQGVIVGGPQTASLSGTSYTWWDVSFSSSPSGWVADIGLTAITPSAPILVGPGDSSSPGTSISALSPTLSWNAASGANGYGVYLYDVTAGALVYNNDSVGNVTSVSVGPLTAGHAFRWNARASDSAGFSGYSSLLYFVEQSASPSISSVSPNPVTGANSAQTLTIYGSGFVSGAQVKLAYPAAGIVPAGSQSFSATFFGSTELQITPTYANDPGEWTAQVINPGSILSSTYSFPVQAPFPVIQSLSPSSAAAGGAAFTLTVNGSTFDQSSVVQWNGANLTTTPTVVSGETTALTAQVPGSDIASSGSAQVTVYTPGPGGGTSSATSFTVNPATSSSFVFGFDASAYGQQDAINWSSVTSSEISYQSQAYPVSFVILRASKGNADVDNCRFKDPDFIARAAAASAAGLLVGAYHVAGVMDDSTGDSYSAASEADFFVGIAGDWITTGNLRPVLDVEDNGCATLSTNAELVAWVDEWMQEVITLTGVTPIIYCDGSFASILQSLASKYDLWIAKPGADPGANPGHAPWNVDLIQYSWSGSVSGVDTAVDLDVFQESLSQFQSALVIGSSAPPATVSVTLSSVPSGLEVIVDGSPFPTPQSVTWQSGSSHTISAPTGQFSVDSHTRYDFLSWSDGGSQTHTVAPAVTTIYTANFDTNYLLDVTASPLTDGTIAGNPPGGWYPPGESVYLTATPQSGYEFVSWTGEDSYSGNMALVVMNGYRSVTANFALLPPPPTFSSVSLSGRTIQLNLSGLSLGTTVVLESSPDLKIWTPIQTNTAPGTTLSLSISLNGSLHAGFLRVGVH
jgi:GH25 family lysozyme M1 (1,4-beta-N-acetylmuramidase)